MSNSLPSTRGSAVPRRAERTRLSRLARICLLDGKGTGGEIDVALCDFSPTGVGLISPASLERGRQFILRVWREDGSADDLLYSVAHCSPLAGGKHRLGAEFVCVVPHELPAAPAPGDSSLESRLRSAILR